MQYTKRLLIKSGLAFLALASLPGTLLAGIWPKETFSAATEQDSLRSMFGVDATTPSDKINLKAPEIAENGAVVPISIDTSLENVESISILVKNNPRPMAAHFEIPPGTLSKISSRIKMGETSDVVAIVKTSNGVFSTAKEVKVTIGGCGG
jgi:sulfur-oxidizing protein SoxY